MPRISTIRVSTPTQRLTVNGAPQRRVGRQWGFGKLALIDGERRYAPRQRVLTQAGSSVDGVKAVIEDLRTLGTLRFICIGDGGILESAQKFDEYEDKALILTDSFLQNNSSPKIYCLSSQSTAKTSEKNDSWSKGRCCCFRVSYNEIPNKGTYCTLKTTDRAFEAHIALAKVSTVKLVKSKPKTGDYDIYKVSFLREDGGPMLTCLLHGPDGSYEPGAIEAWEALRAKNGETVTVK